MSGCVREFMQRSLVEPYRLVELVAPWQPYFVGQDAVARVVPFPNVDGCRRTEEDASPQAIRSLSYSAPVSVSSRAGMFSH